MTEDFITTQRLDPVTSPGRVSPHVHSGSLSPDCFWNCALSLLLVLGGSKFGFNTSTDELRQSECTSIPIPEDKSNYWFSVSFSSLFHCRRGTDGPPTSTCTFSMFNDASLSIDSYCSFLGGPTAVSPVSMAVLSCKPRYSCFVDLSVHILLFLVVCWKFLRKNGSWALFEIICSMKNLVPPLRSPMMWDSERIPVSSCSWLYSSVCLVVWRFISVSLKYISSIFRWSNPPDIWSK